jgi:acetolactate synthase-1/3 small subunit
MAKHTIIAMVENKPGVLNRVASLFRRRGFNIESIAVGHTEMDGISRMTIVVDGTGSLVEQVRKQLDKLIDVVKVTDITEDSMLARELALIKVNTTPATRSEVIEIVDIFRAKIVDVSADSVVVEVSGDEDKLESLLRLLRGFGIKEIARTGRIAITRGTAGPILVEEEGTRREQARPRKKKGISEISNL